MTFTISAWEHRNGRYVPVTLEGPIDPRSLSDFRLPDEASPTAGRANPTLGNLLHADMCADPSEARW